jgi:hypothetical protein
VRDKRGSESRERRQIRDSRFAFALAFAHTTTPYILLLASLNPSTAPSAGGHQAHDFRERSACAIPLLLFVAILPLSSPIARERKISWRLVCSHEAGVSIPCARVRLRQAAALLLLGGLTRPRICGAGIKIRAWRQIRPGFEVSPRVAEFGGRKIRSRSDSGAEEGGVWILALVCPASCYETMREESNKKSKVRAFRPIWSLIFSSPCQLFCVSDKFGAILLAIVQLSWSKSLVRKWLNIKSKGQDVQVDCYANRGMTGSLKLVIWFRVACLVELLPSLAPFLKKVTFSFLY